MLFNVVQHQVLALRENAESDLIIRDPERVLTGTGTNHRIEHLGTNRVGHQLEQQTTTMINRTSWRAASRSCLSGRLKIRGNKWWSSKKITRAWKNKDGNRTELVARSTVYLLQAKVLDGNANGKLLCNMNSVDMRALEDAASSSSVQQLNIEEELIQAEAYGPKITARLRKGNPSEGLTQSNVAHVPEWFGSWRAGHSFGLLLHELQEFRSHEQLRLSSFGRDL